VIAQWCKNNNNGLKEMHARRCIFFMLQVIDTKTILRSCFFKANMYLLGHVQKEMH